MALVKLKDFYPQYRQKIMGGDDVIGLPVYAGKTDEQIGIVADDVIDFTGRFRYLVIDTQQWGIDKKILLPVHQSLFDAQSRCIYALEIFTKSQVIDLPEYVNGITLFEGHETLTEIPETLAENSEIEPPKTSEEVDEVQTLQLYEEQVIAKKERRQVGEVALGKRVETQTEQISIDLEKERIVIERKTLPKSERRVVSGSSENFQPGEVARIKIYEEVFDLAKEVVVREEVTISKKIEIDTVETETTVRREALDIQQKGEQLFKGDEGF